MSSAEKTLYIVGDYVFAKPELESAEQAVDRLRSCWARIADPRTSEPFNIRLRGIGGAFASVNGITPYRDQVPTTDAQVARLFDEADSGRVFWLWSETWNNMGPQAEPQVDVLEKRGGEARMRHIQSTSLREFVATHLDDNDADRSLLYRIRVSRSESHLIHGVHVEHALNLVRRGLETGVMPYTPDQALAIAEQLDLAQRDHEMRNEATALKP